MVKKLGFKPLEEEERKLLEEIMEKKELKGRTIQRAQILLACDEKGSGKEIKVAEIAEALGVSRTTVQNIRADYFKGGLEYALYNKRQTSDDPKHRKITEEVALKILEMIEEEPPKGKRWTIRLICAECKARGILGHVSTGAIKNMLHKYNVDLTKEGKEN